MQFGRVRRNSPVAEGNVIGLARLAKILTTSLDFSHCAKPRGRENESEFDNVLFIEW